MCYRLDKSGLHNLGRNMSALARFHLYVIILQKGKKRKKSKEELFVSHKIVTDWTSLSRKACKRNISVLICNDILKGQKILAKCLQ